MATPFISYDKDLPSIEGRLPWEEPKSHLIKDEIASTGWREQEGRRESQLLLVPKIRNEVQRWREAGYPGASEVTLRLFEYWFLEDHAVLGYPIPFRYHFCQREAIETFVWLIEVAKQGDAQALIRAFADIYKKDLWTDNLVFQTTMDGRRQVRRYVPELDDEGVQDLPPENLGRFAFKMATGSGKTWVMAMVIVWSHFHKKMVAGSELSSNFLIVAPNIIVYQRLEKDFASNRIFHDIPLIPPEWKGKFSQKVILRGENTEPNASGNLFLTNVQQLYEFRDGEMTPANAIQALLGPKPKGDPSSSPQRSMLERLKSLRDLLVINDEAHHVHDVKLQWSQSLLAIHHTLPNGLAGWLDFSATPKDQNGMYFPWTVCDYPLAQAVEDRIVKAPIIVTKEDDPGQPTEDPDNVNAHNAPEKYQFWIHAAVQRWRDHEQVLGKLGRQAVLFIMAERNTYADAIGDYLLKTTELGFKTGEILVIHTDTTGDVSRKDLAAARAAARDIDAADSKVKAIVSVMMLREGWDVRNVTVVLGLRPFSAKAEILPEQVVGRGLRLITDLSPDRTQTLEVLGTRNLLRVLHGQLESEGVGVISTSDDPPTPVIVEPIRERVQFDIAIPLTKPSLIRDMRKLAELEVAQLEPVYDQEELEEPIKNQLKMAFATTETEVHRTDLEVGNAPQAQQLLASITVKVTDRAKLPNRFADLYPRVKSYVTDRCFGKKVDVDSPKVRRHLGRLEVQEGIAKYLARAISALTLERRAIELEKADFRMSQTKPFQWRRNLPPLQADKTIFNYVATYNDFERQFAEFLDRASDVVRFASLGTTEQGDSGTQFRVDYIKESGAIGFYHPDWVVVQRTKKGEVNWIIETKGRVWEGTLAKDSAMSEWCHRLAEDHGYEWHYTRVNQVHFNSTKATTLAGLLQTVPTLDL